MATSTQGSRSFAFVHVLVVVLAVCASVEAAAEAPELLRVQGVVTQLQGGPVADGDYMFRAEIFDVAVGGSPLFSTTVTAPVVAGAYSLPIAPAVPGELTSALEGAGPRFVQVTVVEDAAGTPINETLLPRQQLASVPYALAAQSSRVLVGSHAANGDPEVVLPLPTEFDRFEINLIDVLPDSVSPVDFWVQVSTDGGLSWDQGAQDYKWNVLHSSNSSVNTSGSASDSKILLNWPVAPHRLLNDPMRSFAGKLEIRNPGGGSGYFQLVGDRGYIDSPANGSNPTLLKLFGTRTDPTFSRVDALRFKMSAGNIQGGEFNVYGLR